MLGLLAALLAPAPAVHFHLTQAQVPDSAHTLITPPGANPMTMQNGGPGFIIGGTPNRQVIIPPGGGGAATVTPNGNGTSTVQHSNGRTETVNTPR